MRFACMHRPAPNYLRRHFIVLTNLGFPGLPPIGLGICHFVQFVAFLRALSTLYPFVSVALFVKMSVGPCCALA
jgi:hypothetical protein